MKIIERIKERFKPSQSVKQIVAGITENYKERKENGEENPIDNTVEDIMKIIEENPEPETVAKNILIATLEEEQLPNRVSEKLSTKISETTEIPDSVISSAIEEMKEDIPDEVINTIIKEGDIKVSERHKLIRNIEDIDILKENIENELEILYRICKDKQDREIADRINELKNIFARKNIDANIEGLIERVVAKKMAENYYNDITKGTKIYELSQCIPVEKMFEKNLPAKVKEEFKKIEEKEGQKEGRYKEDELKGLILDKIAQNVAAKYKKSGIFVIPQSGNMKALSDDEINKFIKVIETSIQKPLTNNAIANIQEQIKGNVNKNKIKEHILINKIKNLSEDEKDEYIEFFIDILNEKETLKSLSIIRNSGFIKQFNSMPEKRKKITIEMLDEVLGKRNKYKIAQQSPRINGIQIKKIDSEEKDR